jgi:hypothetical protein
VDDISLINLQANGHDPVCGLGETFPAAHRRFLGSAACQGQEGASENEHSDETGHGLNSGQNPALQLLFPAAKEHLRRINRFLVKTAQWHAAACALRVESGTRNASFLNMVVSQ